uniref:Adhesion molecule with Ig like domain 2 n=1 Tax=Gouania willdenowi TaxID=441366 RepID=A0A8C5EX61_GOUWI
MNLISCLQLSDICLNPAVLLLLGFGSFPFVASCPPCCFCASDIISCGGCNLSMLPIDLPSYATRLDLSHNAFIALPVDWNSRLFDWLATLVLRKNFISRIEENVFKGTPHLLHLDLSSNKLTTLNSSIFSGLKELKDLLLYGNEIVSIAPGAFTDLYSLKKLYLSSNRLTAFPLALYENLKGPRNLTFLDLSYNNLTKVPVQSLLLVSRHGGIYLQENPLECDCQLLALLEYWTRKQYSPLMDFRSEYSCEEVLVARINCSQQGGLEVPLDAQTYQVVPGQWLTVPCPGLTLPLQEGQVVFWVTPDKVLNSSIKYVNGHFTVLANGTLEIQGATVEDSGTYGCVVVRGRHYSPSESLEVTVVVGNLNKSSTSGLASRSGAEHFNTAFTTLASCLVSIILVLLYLYLTPCRCREGGGSGGCGGRAIMLCSDPREAESGQRRSNGKRVAFLEPQPEDFDNGDPKTPALNLGQITTEGILKNGKKTVEKTPENSSPIVKTYCLNENTFHVNSAL